MGDCGFYEICSVSLGANSICCHDDGKGCALHLVTHGMVEKYGSTYAKEFLNDPARVDDQLRGRVRAACDF